MLKYSPYKKKTAISKEMMSTLPHTTITMGQQSIKSELVCFFDVFLLICCWVVPNLDTPWIPCVVLKNVLGGGGEEKKREGTGAYTAGEL